jgi:hypothetical protein
LRARSRGISRAHIGRVLSHYDIDLPVGDACRVLRLSKAAAADAASGCPSLAAKLAKIALVENESTGAIVTALIVRPGAAGRRYRRSH